MAEKWFTVGKVANTHGIRGELKVIPHTDFPEQRFAPGSRLTLLKEESVSGGVPVEVQSARLHKNVYIVKLKGYNDINEVEKYKGWMLKIAENQREKLDEDEYYYSDIIGCRAVTEDGEELGTISEILSPGANDVWVVDLPKKKQLLLPVIDDVIIDVDVKEKRVTVRLMEGMM